MSFATALSGLRAASTSLDTTSHNIANVNTTGFKRSRAEFADVFATSLGGVARTQPGAGVKVTEIAQQFNQGTVEFTQNSLDLAISGNGFFALADTPDAPVPTAYSRNGAFQLDADGNVVNDQGRFLMTFAPNGDRVEDGFSQGVFQTLKIDTSQGLPRATENIDTTLNLNAALEVPDTAPFDPTDPTSFNSTTSVTIFDSQGNDHTLSTFYVKTDANTWEAYYFVDGFGLDIDPTADPADPGDPLANPPIPPTPVTLGAFADPTTSNVPGQPVEILFDNLGQILSIDGAGTAVNFANVNLSQINPNLNVADLNFDINLLGSTQFNSPFSVNNLTQDGLTAGNLSGLDVSNEGVIFARFTNGGTKPLGQVALARFPSNQGLSKIGDTTWTESSTSGQPVFGAGGGNNFGLIQSSALETSNVDISEELVRLIIDQQAFQANSQAISTRDQVIQAVLNI
ncbi:MAG: flagellar hook protein FlgE [Methylococcales bacterium]|nr:flagellar hook protein FlgE [Methylococcales bacterium]